MSWKEARGVSDRGSMTDNSFWFEWFPLVTFKWTHNFGQPNSRTNWQKMDTKTSYSGKTLWGFTRRLWTEVKYAISSVNSDLCQQWSEFSMNLSLFRNTSQENNCTQSAEQCTDDQCALQRDPGHAREHQCAQDSDRCKRNLTNSFEWSFRSVLTYWPNSVGSISRLGEHPVSEILNLRLSRSLLYIA